MWATGETQHLEVEASGITWDAHWIPVTEDLYMHFAFDITERKKADEELRFQSEIITNMAEAVYLVEWKMVLSSIQIQYLKECLAMDKVK